MFGGGRLHQLIALSASLVATFQVRVQSSLIMLRHRLVHLLLIASLVLNTLLAPMAYAAMDRTGDQGSAQQLQPGTPCDEMHGMQHPTTDTVEAAQHTDVDDQDTCCSDAHCTCGCALPMALLLAAAAHVHPLPAPAFAAVFWNPSSAMPTAPPFRPPAN